MSLFTVLKAYAIVMGTTVDGCNGDSDIDAVSMERDLALLVVMMVMVLVKADATFLTLMRLLLAQAINLQEDWQSFIKTCTTSSRDPPSRRCKSW